MILHSQRPINPVYTAREGVVGYAEGCFPDLQIGNAYKLILISIVAFSRERVVPTISNSGMMKSTWEVLAPASRNTTTRFPLSIISPSVGQSACLTGTLGGTNARGVIPAHA